VGPARLASHLDPQVAFPGRCGLGRNREGLAPIDLRRRVPVTVVHRHRDVRRATMNISRRKALMSALFGAGYVGLRALATAIPAGFLLRGRRAFAEGAATCANPAKAQFVILSTSGAGDPINANAPGTYEDPNIAHPADPTMAPTNFMLGGVAAKAAMPWSTL